MSDYSSSSGRLGSRDPYGDETTPIHLQQSTNPSSTVWFISFGDLLTLLVCFFLVLTPWKKLNQPSKPKTSHIVKSMPLGVEVPGTTFAQASSQSGVKVTALTSSLTTDGAANDARSQVDRGFVLLAEIPVFRSQVGKPSLAGLANLAESIARELKGLQRHVDSITIRVCDRDANAEEVTRTVGRMVEDQRLPGVVITVGYPTASCKEADVMRPVTDEVVAAITVFGNATP